MKLRSLTSENASQLRQIVDMTIFKGNETKHRQLGYDHYLPVYSGMKAAILTTIHLLGTLMFCPGICINHNQDKCTKAIQR
jgi:hypothetical protein